MSTALLTAVISAGTSVVVVLVAQWTTARSARSSERRLQAERITVQYLNPLRLQVAETAFRNYEYANRSEQGQELGGLSPIASPDELSNKPAEWFVGEGCYLISTAYLTACLFAEMTRLRDNYAYLRLADSEADTELPGHLVRVSIAFLRDHGVYYVLQSSIGRDLRTRAGSLLSYREFCERLREPSNRVWFDRLINFYIEVGRSDEAHRLKRTTKALHDLSSVLDRAVGGSASLSDRFLAEDRGDLVAST
jgi:hypothetical protein